MAYIGNQQTQGFSQVPAKQDFTNITGTSLTLTHAVASAEGISLFINNVRQEPTTAYSIGADGVTVTLTGSVVATDDIYVVYNSLALQTTVTPDASVSTAKIIDGSVTSAKLDTNIDIAGDLTVDTSTLKVDSSSGNVGIGTVSPSGLQKTLNIDGGSSGASLALDGGSNFAVMFTGATASDPTSLYSNTGFKFATATAKDATGFSEKMRISSNGNVGIGTDADWATFTVLNAAKTASDVLARFLGTSTLKSLIVRGDGDCENSNNSYGALSDVKLKENIVDTTPKLADLMKVQVRNYNLIGTTDKQIGVVAQELEQIFPNMIKESPDTNNEGEETGETTKSVKYSVFVPILIKALQEQQETITALEARITALEAS